MKEQKQDFNIEVTKADQIRIALDMLEIVAGGRRELYNILREERVKIESELVPRDARCLN